MPSSLRLAERAPLEDEVLPEALASEFIDGTAAAASLLRAHEVLGSYLAERDFELVDGCFFMSRDDRVICGEVSPDNLTIAYVGAHVGYLDNGGRRGAASPPRSSQATRRSQ
jgi:hypothetical protein